MTDRSEIPQFGRGFVSRYPAGGPRDVEKLRGQISLWAGIAADIAKISSIIASVMGAVVLLFYGLYTSSPFPTNPGAAIPILMMISVIFLFISVNFALLVIFPISSENYVWPNTKLSFATLFGGRVDGPKRKFLFVCHYVAMYAPFVLLSGAFFFWKSITVYGAAMVTLAGYLLGLAIFTEEHWRKRLDSYVASVLGYILSVSATNIFAIFWILPLISILISQLPEDLKRTEGIPAYGIALTILTSLISLHAMLSSTKPTRKIVAGIGAFVAILLLTGYPGISSLSAMTLRILGVGGGMPANIVVKEWLKNTDKFSIVEKSGCIILNFGSDLIFHETPRVNDEVCKVPPALLSPFAGPAKFSYIAIYTRSDVLEIHKFSPINP